MRTALTKRIVAAAQPQARPYELRDNLVRGLILRVQPSGYKAWIVSWAHGKRRTLGAMEHLTLDQARAHARHTVAEYVQQGLPSIAKVKPTSCTLDAFLTDRYAPWARVELKGGRKYVERIQVVFAGMLDTPLTDINAALIDTWWRDRLTTKTTQTGNPPTKATAARDLACLRSALTKAVDWHDGRDIAQEVGLWLACSEPGRGHSASRVTGRSVRNYGACTVRSPRTTANCWRSRYP